MKKIKVKKKHKDVISFTIFYKDLNIKSLERGVKLTYTTFTLVPL